MSNTESLQLVKDYTEGKVHQQVEFYIVSTPDHTFEGLIDNLRTSFQSREDEATVKGEFYSRKQYSKESVEDFRMSYNCWHIKFWTSIHPSRHSGTNRFVSN